MMIPTPDDSDAISSRYAGPVVMDAASRTHRTSTSTRRHLPTRLGSILPNRSLRLCRRRFLPARERLGTPSLRDAAYLDVRTRTPALGARCLPPEDCFQLPPRKSAPVS